MAAREFLLPDLGEGLEDAEIVTWRVAEGDHVELNQALVEVNTAKALVEIPSPWEGVVEKLFAAEGDVVKVGQPVVSISVDDAAATEVAVPQAESTKPKRRAVLVGYGVEEEEGPAVAEGEGSSRSKATREEGGGDRSPVAASPPVRRLAKELGIDLAAVAGTGPGGRVTREDVTNASQGEADPNGRAVFAAATPAAGDTDVIPVKGTRRLIAEKMTRSVREIPHVTTFLTVDASWVQALRAELTEQSGERISPLPIVVRALVEVIGDHPKLNSSFDAERSEITVYRRCHVGIATDTERGLVVTVVRDAGDRGILDISKEIARLAAAARAGTARPEEVVGGTITVSNVGSFGADSGTPIINHPEAAILAPGVIEPRALVVDGRVEARPAMTLSLSFDHRVLDGAEAGRALRALGNLLESPFKLGSLPR